ncbi:MAG: hypothetical protein CMC15_17990 [Flavobacteriaceae bacterium]|nr:hypothetical protein [Flavobacteriaceae bacterium]
MLGRNPGTPTPQHKQNKTPTNQTPNLLDYKKIKKQQPTPHQTHSNHKTKTPKTQITCTYIQGASAHRPNR